MKDVIKYKDLIGSVRFSSDDKVFYGKIEGIDDLVTFEGKSVDTLVSAFEEAVEDYIALCREADKPVQKSFKGSFNVRIDPELHKKAALLSANLGLSLNQLVEDAFQRYLADKSGAGGPSPPAAGVLRFAQDDRLPTACRDVTCNIPAGD